MKNQYTTQQIRQNRGFFSFHRYMMIKDEIVILHAQFEKEYERVQDATAGNVVSMDRQYLIELRGFVSDLQAELDSIQREKEEKEL